MPYKDWDEMWLNLNYSWIRIRNGNVTKQSIPESFRFLHEKSRKKKNYGVIGIRIRIPDRNEFRSVYLSLETKLVISEMGMYYNN